MKILFLCEKKDTILMYKNIKSKISYCDTSYEELSNSLKVDLSNYNLLIIDLISKRYLNLLKSIYNKTKIKIIVISSLNFDHSSIYNCINQVLIKPINPHELLNLISNYYLLLKKNIYKKEKNNLLIDLINESPLKFALFDTKGKLVYQNDSYSEINNNQTHININFDDLQLCNKSFKQVLQELENNKTYYDLSYINKSWYKNCFFTKESTKCIAHFCDDITIQKNTTIKLKRSIAFFQESNESMYIMDKNGLVLEINKAFSDTTGYSKEHILGKNISLLNSGIHNIDFYKNIRETLNNKGKWQGEIWNKRKNGELYPEWLSISKFKNEDLNEINYLATSTDVSSIKNADKKLHFYANYDPLTKLLNRAQFDNLLSQTIKNSIRRNNVFALLFIDLDNFKEVNDTYGHLVGDKLLKIVANRFRQTLRKEDLIARIGGDEFNIILENIQNYETAILMAEKLNKEINKKITIENKDFFATLSIGVAIFPTHGEDIHTLTKHADIAMYEVKNRGKNGVQLYNSKYTEKLLKKVTMQNELKYEILNKNLQMYYQPIFNTKTKALEGAEALVRWEHKEKGFIPPDEFILVAEKSDLIITLGKFIQEKVFEDILLINSRIKNTDMVYGINISSKEFFEDYFVENLLQKLKDFEISSKQLEIEITETHMMKNHNIAVEILNKLKNNGIKLAIDDFGTGYSSLNYLKNFPVNKLKIDKSFIDDILINNDDMSIVKTIITMAKIFNLEVQAEGVESKEQLTQLEDLDCQFIQGYYYAKPMPLNNFIQFIELQDKSNGRIYC